MTCDLKSSSGSLDLSSNPPTFSVITLKTPSGSDLRPSTRNPQDEDQDDWKGFAPQSSSVGYSDDWSDDTPNGKDYSNMSLVAWIDDIFDNTFTQKAKSKMLPQQKVFAKQLIGDKLRKNMKDKQFRETFRVPGPFSYKDTDINYSHPVYKLKCAGCSRLGHTKKDCGYKLPCCQICQSQDHSRMACNWVIPHGDVEMTLDDLLFAYKHKNIPEFSDKIDRAVLTDEKRKKKPKSGNSTKQNKDGPVEVHEDEKSETITIEGALNVFSSILQSTVDNGMRPNKEERKLAVKAMTHFVDKEIQDDQKQLATEEEAKALERAIDEQHLRDQNEARGIKPGPVWVETDGKTLEFPYGFEYSDLEKLRKILLVPEEMTLCFNYWSLSGKSKSHHYAHRMDNATGNHIVDGLFDFGGNQVRLVGPFPEFDNRTVSFTASACGTMIFGTPKVPGAARFDPRGGAPFLLNLESAYHRIEASVRATAYKLVEEKSYTSAGAVNKIRSHYKLCFDIYPELDAHIVSYVQTPHFYQLMAEHQRREQASWPVKAEAALRYLYQRKGYDNDKFVGDVEHKLCKRMCRRRVVCMYLGCLSLMLAGNSCLPMWQQLNNHVVDRVNQRTWVPIQDDHRAVYQDMMKKEQESFKLGIMPCSKLYIRKMIHTGRNTPVVGKRVVLKTDYVPTDDEIESKVEVYGSTIKVPAVYPHNCAENLEAALKIRMAFDRFIDPDEATKFKLWAQEFLKTLPDLDLEMLDEYNYLITTYGLKRGEQLFNLRSQSIDARDAKAELFVKGEMYLGKDATNFKPRMIWSRGPKLVAHFSSTFYQITNQIKDKWFKTATGNRVLYCSGTNPVEVGSFADILNCHSEIYEADVSNWDGSFAEHFLDIELMILQKVNNLPWNFSFLIDNWKHVSGANRDKTVTVKLPYGRRSGDLWTSIFNSVLNWMITLYVLDLKVDSEYHMLVLGDDNVVGFDKADCPVDNQTKYIANIYRNLGMQVGIVQHEDVQDATFCSGRFWPVGGKLIWGVLPFRTMTKYGVNHHNQPAKMFKSLLMGIAKSQMSVSSYIPILGTWQRSVLRSGYSKGLKATMPPKEWWKIGSLCDADFGGPSEDTRQFFAAIYGIPEHVQIMIENWIENNMDIDKFPVVIDDEMFRQGALIEFGCGTELEDIMLTSTPIEKEIYEEARNEELEKLASGTSLLDRLRAAWIFGAEEDDMLDSDTPTHAMLHTIFTFVSHFSLPMGVALHTAYNRYAFSANVAPCMKKKMKNKQKKKPSQTRSKKMEGKKPQVRSLLKAAASLAGGMVAGNLGSRIAENGYDIISKVTGYGDYKVRSNSLMSGNVPEFGKMGHSVRIRHREYLGDILSSTNYVNNFYSINPGNSVTFPWLSTIANSYQQYRFHGLIFAFNSTSATALNSTNTALGTVIMATQYDVASAPFVNKVEMEAHEYACATKPSESSMHPIECAPQDSPTKLLYIRSGALPANTDPRWYDFANFQLATVGSQASSNIGELWVTYDVELSKTRLPSAGVSPGLFFNTRRGGISGSNPFGTTTSGRQINGTLPIVVDNQNITWSGVTAGRFLITLSWSSTTSVTVSFLPPTFSSSIALEPATGNSTEDQGFFLNPAGTSVNSIETPAGGTTLVTVFNYRAVVNVSAVAPNVASLSYSSLPTVPIGNVDITIVSLPTSNVAW